MNMALRLQLGSVIGDGPIIAEQRLGLVHCGTKKLDAKLRRQLIERTGVGARKRQPAAGLRRIDVLQKEDVGIRGLLLGFAAKTARPRFERFRTGMVASACNNIGARKRNRERRKQQERSH